MRILFLICLAILQARLVAAEDDLSTPTRLLLQGKYAESAEMFGKAAAKSPAAAVGLAHARAATGKLEDAEQVLKSAREHPDVYAELARLAFARGDYKAARDRVEAALRSNPDQLLARWIRAELARASGRLDEADRYYKWLVDYYNGHDVKDAESFRWIGLAAAQYARWNRLSDQFRFLVRELYPDALKLDHLYWPAHYEAGLLYAEKYNRADARREFQAALELNPNAAEVHAAVARLALEHRDVEDAQTSLRRALEINPRLIEGRLLKADLAWDNFQPDEAARILENQVLPLNPASEMALGRLAACHALRARPQAQDSASPLARLLRQVNERNPHAGEFYAALAAWLAERNRFAEAEQFFKEAEQRMPQLVGPKTRLGLLAMRAGRETEARKLLQEALAIDPFNVRVNNTLEVLDLLDTYETVEGRNVIVRYDSKRDKTLSRYVLRQAETTYPELCRQFGYRPPAKPLVEIFNQAKGASGHDWFSARMIGLPYLGAVAASTGHIVALTSPNDSGSKGKFNWAQVLRHEMVHVVTLQQTGFNMPHWYTEGLAVWSEGYPRPQLWNELLVQRVPQGQLFTLDTLNFGFTRARTSEDWQMAYCQADLVVKYLLAGRKPDVLQKLAAAYAENLSTPEAIQRACGVSQADFERGYREFVKQTAAGIQGSEPARKADFAERLKAYREHPEDLQIAAELAYASFRRGTDDEARQLAEAVLKRQPKHPLATYVLARLHTRDGQTQKAIDLLQQALDLKRPDLRSLNLLAGLKLSAKRHAEATELFRLGAKLDPHNLGWDRSLAKVYEATKDEAALWAVLVRIGQSDPDDFAVRKSLAQMALARKDYAAAAHWSNRALEIHVTDPEVHHTFAVALAESNNFPQAIEEFETAIDLGPKAAGPRLQLAETYLKADRPQDARRVAESLQRMEPDHPGLRGLLEKIGKAGGTDLKGKGGPSAPSKAKTSPGPAKENRA